MRKRRHVARRLEESFAETFGDCLAECPLWMLDVDNAVGFRNQITSEQISAAIGAPVTAGGNLTIVNGVAVIPVVGMIVTRESWMTKEGYATSQQAVQRQYEAALGSDQVRAIAFYVDSPGGYAQGNEEASRAMFASKGKKPSVAYVEGMMCSAAYYLASVADKIVASPSSLVGSIGSIVVHFEMTKLLEDYGISATVIRNPTKKALGGQFEKLGADGRASWQSKIDQLTEMFQLAVARQRGVTPEKVKESYGQGEAFFAAMALSRGLIDQVGSWNDALSSFGSARTSTVSQVLEAGNVGAMPAASEPVSPLLPASLESPRMNPQLKAALFARGLISSMEANDGECKAALRAFFAGRGESLPMNGEAIDEAKALAGVNAAAPSVSSAVATLAAPLAGAAAPNVQAAHDKEIAEAAAVAELERVEQLQQRGQALGISSEQIKTAVKSRMTVAQALEAWTASLVTSNQPITPVPGGHGGENFMADALDALTIRAFEARPGSTIPVDAARIQRREVQSLRHAPLLAIASQCLAMGGQRVDPYGDREDIAARAMATDGYEKQSFGEFSADVPATRPGSFPNLLSGLANKFMNEGLKLALPTYQEWTGVLAGDLPDFKPVPIMGMGAGGEMQEVLDAEAFKEATLAEELAGVMQLKRYGQGFWFTPVMVANDDLGVFTDKSIGLGMSWELTVNRLCLRILTGNVTLLDGYALYDDTNHGNNVESAGAAPSDSEWEKMQLRLAAMRGINDETYLRHRLDRMLIPDQLWRGATQVFAPFNSIPESKVVTTDSALNVYRGRVTIIVEPELQAVSEKVWYGFANPAYAAAVKRAYFRGFPKQGKRERYYDPRTKCIRIDLEGRVGAAPVQYRNTVKNKGEN